MTVTGAAPPTTPASDAARDGWRSEVRVAIVGGGFAGVGMAIQLKQSGLADFTLFERAGSVGGPLIQNKFFFILGPPSVRKFSS